MEVAKPKPHEEGKTEEDTEEDGKDTEDDSEDFNEEELEELTELEVGSSFASAEQIVAIILNINSVNVASLMFFMLSPVYLKNNYLCYKGESTRTS